jgi:hypothetical protein
MNCDLNIERQALQRLTFIGGDLHGKNFPPLVRKINSTMDSVSKSSTLGLNVLWYALTRKKGTRYNESLYTCENGSW